MIIFFKWTLYVSLKQEQQGPLIMEVGIGGGVSKIRELSGYGLFGLYYLPAVSSIPS